MNAKHVPALEQFMISPIEVGKATRTTTHSFMSIYLFPAWSPTINHLNSCRLNFAIRWMCSVSFCSGGKKNERKTLLHFHCFRQHCKCISTVQVWKKNAENQTLIATLTCFLAIFFFHSTVNISRWSSQLASQSNCLLFNVKPMRRTLLSIPVASLLTIQSQQNVIRFLFARLVSIWKACCTLIVIVRFFLIWNRFLLVFCFPSIQFFVFVKGQIFIYFFVSVCSELQWHLKRMLIKPMNRALRKISS